MSREDLEWVLAGEVDFVDAEAEQLLLFVAVKENGINVRDVAAVECSKQK